MYSKKKINIKRKSKKGGSINIKKDLAYILRGHLFKPNHIPQSVSGEKVSYDQNLKNLWHTHQKMLESLSKYYYITIYFITYDNTPEYILDWAQNIGKIIIIESNNSTQFGTLSKGMEYVDKHDCYFITRTDILFLKKMFQIMTNYGVINGLAILNKESNTGISNDIIFYLSHSHRSKFEKYLKTISNNAHSIGMVINKIKYITQINVKFVRAKNNLYILQGKMHNT